MEEAKKRDLLPVHVIIAFLFMFGFGYLPAPAPITPLGMKMLGVFLGLIYGWSFSTLVWPSLMGMLALVLNDCVTFKNFITLGFANDTVVFLFFIFAFVAAIEQEGITNYLANWCISRKSLVGHPWRLSFGILAGAMVTSGLTNTFASILIFWGIFYSICKQAGFKPYDKYPTVMILGIAIFAIFGTCMLPYRTTPLIVLGTYQSLTGVSVDYLRFMVFMIPLLLISLAVYLLSCRFLFRVDVAGLKAIKIDFVKPEDLIMNKRQKIVMSFLALFVFLAMLPAILPKTFIITQMLNKMTTTGIAMLILLIMLWVKVEGKPLINYQQIASKGIMWDMMLLFIVVMPLSSLLMGDDTGIKAFMVGILKPIFGGVSPVVFMFAVLFLTGILTNFANNIVIGLIFIQIICSMSDILGVNATPLIITLTLCVNLAFYTPAASAPVAMVFGNVEWIKGKDIYTMGGVLILILMLSIIFLGLVWGNIIF